MMPLRSSSGRPDEVEAKAPVPRKKQAMKLPFSKVGTLRFSSSKRMPARWVSIDLNTRTRDREDMLERLKKLDDRNYDELRTDFFPAHSSNQIWDRLNNLVSVPPAEGSNDDKVLAKALELASTQALKELVAGDDSIWKLPPPSALISVTGGAGSLHMTDKQKLIFRRGLLSAAKLTNAWIMTGGTNAGVMQMVGRMLQESSVEVPCIGVAAWGVVADKEEMAQRKDGRVLDYNGKTVLKKETPLENQRVALDPNHSHFVLVDNGKEGGQAFGSEIDLRAAFETCICSSSFGRDEDGTKLPVPPMVLLVVGGGPNTLDTIKATLKQDRPVVVFVDSGGAAKHLRDWWDNTEMRRKNTPGSKADETLLASFDLQLPTLWTPEMYMDRLKEVCELGRQPKGALRMPQLSFFSTSDDVSAGNDLDMRILTSLLSDVETTMEAVKLAVSWGEPTIIRTQLDESKEHDKKGLAQVFERALLSGNAPVAETLIQYNAQVGLVHLDRLWNTTFRTLGIVGETASDKQGQAVLVSPLKNEQRSGKWVSPEGRPHKHEHKSSVWARNARVGIDDMRGSTMAFTSNASQQDRLSRIVGQSDQSELRKLLSFIDYDKHLMARIHISDQLVARIPESDVLSRKRVSYIRPVWCDLMLWAVVTGQPDLALSLWKKTQDPLRCAVLASRCAQRMQEREFPGEWMEQRELYEKWAIGMLDAIEKENKSDAAKLLLVFEMTSKEEELWHSSIADEATKSGDLNEPPRKVVSHSHCQRMLDGIFSGHFPGSTATINQNSTFVDIFLAVITFSLYNKVDVKPNGMPDWERNDDDESDDDDDDDDDDEVDEMWMEKKEVARSKEVQAGDSLRMLSRMLRLLAVPKVKFLVHNLFTAAFVMVFTYAFCGLPWQAQPYMWHGEGKLDGSSISGWEMLVWIWALTRMLEELRQMVFSGREYFTSPWNWVDLINYTAIITSTVLRVVAYFDLAFFNDNPPNIGGVSIAHSFGQPSLGALGISHAVRDDMMLICQSLYAISALLMWVRLIEQLGVNRDVGVLRIILALMISDISTWFVITLCFTIGFGILFTVMMPGNVLRNDEQYKPFWGPFWGLLGDSDLAGAYEYHPAHTDGGLRNFPPLAPSFIVPFFVWIYSFLSTVVLVNLLIAQMSSTYERVKENSAEFWEFDRVSLIREYKDNKDPLPPPFNVLWYLYILLNRLCGKDERAHSRGFKWPRKRQGANDVYKIGSTARTDFLALEARKESLAVANRVELLHRGQRILESEQRSQFESLTGRIEAMKKDVHEMRFGDGLDGGGSSRMSRVEAAGPRHAAPPRLTAVPLQQGAPADGRSVLQPSSQGSVGYGFGGPRPDYPHRPAPVPGGSAADVSSASRQQPFQMPLHEVARAALASLPPIPPTLPQAQRLPAPGRNGSYPPRST